MFLEIVSLCRNLLENHPELEEYRSYLNNRLSHKAQERFQFGYFPDTNNLHKLTNFIDKKDLIKANLLYENEFIEYDEISDYLDSEDIERTGALSRSNYTKTKKVKNKTYTSVLEYQNLIMPYKNVYGDIVAIVGRTILENYQELQTSKYKNTKFDKTKHLFGLYEAKEAIIKQNYAIIVEGQFDCISANDHDILNVAAVGSSNITFDQISLLSRYTKNIKILFDNDVAGNTGYERAKEKYSKYVNIEKITLPQEYKDLDEFLQYNTKEEFLLQIN